MKKMSPKFIEIFKNTNELSISIPGKFAKPMIIEGNTFVFFDEFEILLQNNENFITWLNLFLFP